MRVFLRCCVLFGALVFVTGALVPATAGAHPRRVPRPRHTRHRYPTVNDVRNSHQPSELAGGEVSVTGPPLTYQGGIDGTGVTIGTPRVYLVFWGSQWGPNLENDPAGVGPRLEALLNGIGTNDESWSGVMTQYCEGVPVGTEVCPANSVHVGYPTGGALAGVWIDTASTPPDHAGAVQIANEAITAATHFGNTTASANRSVQYVIASPTGTHPDGFNAGGGFCAWHDYITSPAYGDIAYTNLPYIPDMGSSCGANFVNAGAAGALDGVTMVEGHEYAETITDQNPAGGWIDQNGAEDADKCAWRSSGDGRAQDVSFSTGTFAMQGTWSNDGQTCAISHAIRGVPGLPDDFQLALSARSVFVAPGNSGTAQLTSVTVAGNPQSVQLSAVNNLPPHTNVFFSPQTIGSDGASAMTVTTTSSTPDGQYEIPVTGAGSQLHSLSFTLVVGPLPPQLQIDHAVSGISGSAGSDQYWEIDIPPGYHETDFTIAGGTGNADLYVAQDVLPTDDNFNCGSVTPGNIENCHLWGIRDQWFVRIRGTADFSGLSLQVSADSPTRMFNGLIFSNIFDTAGSQRYYWVRVDPGARNLKVSITSFHGDADLYGRYYAFPDPFVTACKPPKIGRHSESCSIKDPAPGIWYFGVYGKTDYSTLKLKVKTR